MTSSRLHPDERRKAIVAAAVPLFARDGFAGTTTRAIAGAAHISEALLFKHFPTKQLLYREILHLGCEGDPVLERLASLEPSTATLVRMVHFMVRHFLQGCARDESERDTRLRLVLYSFLDDGEYARELFETIFARVHPLFAASIDAATEAGDCRPGPLSPSSSFWFGQHVAAMAAFGMLSGHACVPYHRSRDALVDEASWFILRGIGVADRAIAAELAGATAAPTPVEAGG
jgi:AcrR family transcriptional regulator